MKITPTKWRPSLSMVVVSMLIFILCLPITGIWLFRFYDSQLVRETEQELIVQAAFIEAIMVEQLEKLPPEISQRGINISKNDFQKGKSPNKYLEAQLDLTTDSVLPPREDPRPANELPDFRYLEIGKSLDPVLERAQKTTLAGFRVLDYNGTIIAGRSHLGQSLAHVYEVQKALNGSYASVIRQRISKSPKPPIYTISRGTGIRVFVTMPVIFEDHVAGVVYLSRTPSHFLRELYDQKWKIALAVLSMLLITSVIAYVFVRTIKGPIEALNARTNRISNGDKTALEPLEHHGTRELASLSEGLLSMSKKLHDRSDYINTFASHVSHELKSPLTSIQGATELLRDASDQMSEEERNKFLTNIMGDTERLTKLLDRLRDLAEADNSDHEGVSNLAEQVDLLKLKFSKLTFKSSIPANCSVKLTAENLDIILSNLIANSKEHGAENITISAKERAENIAIQLQDDGEGISDLNRDKIFQLFFTTKRENGGTGMGLGIIQSLLTSHGGSIQHVPTETGTCFELIVPKAD